MGLLDEAVILNRVHIKNFSHKKHACIFWKVIIWRKREKNLLQRE